MHMRCRLLLCPHYSINAYFVVLTMRMAESCDGAACCVDHYEQRLQRHLPNCIHCSLDCGKTGPHSGICESVATTPLTLLVRGDFVCTGDAW